MLGIACARCGREIDGPLHDDEHGRYVHSYDCQGTITCPCCLMAGAVAIFKVDRVGVHGKCTACDWVDLYAADLSPHTINPMWGEIRAQRIDEHRREHDIEGSESDGADTAEREGPAGAAEGEGLRRAGEEGV
jgi:hypothetical protein